MRSTANLQYAVYQHTCSLIYDSKSNQTVRQFSSHNVKTIKTVSFCGKFFNGRWLLYCFHRIESADVCVLTSLLIKCSLKMSFSKYLKYVWIIFDCLSKSCLVSFNEGNFKSKMKTLLAYEFNSLHIEVISFHGCPGIGHLYKRILYKCTKQCESRSGNEI